MPEETSTFASAMSAATGPDVPERLVVDWLHDLVKQAVDEYVKREHPDQTSEWLSRSSLGQKLRSLQPADAAVIAALKSFRASRLRAQKAAHLDAPRLRDLEKEARLVIETAGVTDLAFHPRVPLRQRVANSVSIETLAGYRSFDILHADVLLVPSDLLIISTHANPEVPPTGQLVDALAREKIFVDSERVFQVIERGAMWTLFQECEGHETVRAVLTARIKSSKDLADPGGFFDLAVSGVFASLAALEHLGHRFSTISLPVIYGQRIVDYSAATRSLLKHGLTWLKKSAHTSRINFVVYEADELAAWDAALNEVTGRSLVTAGSDQVLQGMVREVAHLLRGTTTGPLSAASGPLLEALSSPNRICLEHVCVFARKLCEELASALVRQYGLKTSPILMNNIEALRESGRVAPWICSYMHSLRIFGNETVHTRGGGGHVPDRLDQHDLVAALSALRSLLHFWASEYRPTAPESKTADP